MKNLKYLLLSPALVLSPLACRSTKPKSLEYQLQETRSDEIAHIDGFGQLAKIDKQNFPVKMHQVYQTSSGHYIGRTGAWHYVFDGLTGQILTHGAHQIMRVECTGDTKEKFITSIGGNIKEDYTPRSLKEFDKNQLEYLTSKVEEREDGLYIKNWSQYKK